MTARRHHICKLLCITLLAIITGCHSGDVDSKVPQIIGDTLLIDVSGQHYKIKRFGNVLWMMENFRSTQGTNPIYIYDAILPLDPNKTQYYGYLYNYQSASELNPQDWKLPSEADLDSLLSYFEVPYEHAGAYLKGDEEWMLKSDSSLMNFAPAGRGYKTTTHEHAGSGTECYFWLSDQNKLGARAVKMQDYTQAIGITFYSMVEEYMTVRYIKYEPVNNQ